jgi:PAS domain-containing protein
MLESLASQTSISLQSAEFFERVEQQRRRFETIFHTLPIGVSVIDAASRQLISNPAGVSLLNLPAQIEPENYPASISFRRFRDGVELSFQEMPLMRALGGEAVRGEEVEMVFPDGRRITVLISASKGRSLFTPTSPRSRRCIRSWTRAAAVPRNRRCARPGFWRRCRTIFAIP